MSANEFRSREAQGLSTRTLRDVAAILFRRRWLVLVSFAGICLGVLGWGLLFPAYAPEMKIIVTRERLDPVVASQPTGSPQPTAPLITEEDLNSEVELLLSNDILRKVVTSNHLQSLQPSWLRRRSNGEEVQIERAIREFKSGLEVKNLLKTNMILVRYKCSDPELGARLLKSLANSYVEKHLEVHRPSGGFKFFEQQTEQYRESLAGAESRLAEFTREQGVTSAALERDITLQKLKDFEAAESQARAAVAETRRRIQILEARSSSLPARVTTQMHTADNPHLLQQLKSTLLELQLKRTDLLAKFEPTYRPVQQVEKQIEETRAAIAAEERAPVREQTTDQNPASQWIYTELEKSRAELGGLRARAAALNRTVGEYRETAQRLLQNAIVQQDLLRTAKAEEDAYLLYLRKQEEARINDALDQRGILNVAIAEAPTVPALPARGPVFYALMSILLAGTVSTSLALVADFLDPCFRTPDEVAEVLEAPVLASIPRQPKLA